MKSIIQFLANIFPGTVQENMSAAEVRDALTEINIKSSQKEEPDVTSDIIYGDLNNKILSLESKLLSIETSLNSLTESLSAANVQVVENSNNVEILSVALSSLNSMFGEVVSNKHSSSNLPSNSSTPRISPITKNNNTSVEGKIDNGVLVISAE